MAIVRSLTVNASLNTTQFESGAKKVQDELRDLRAVTVQASVSFASMGSALLSAAANAAAAALSFQAVKGAVTSLVAETMKLDGLMSAFKAIGGSASEAQKMLKFVREEANRLGLSASAAAEGFKSISAAAKGTALEGSGAQKIFTAVAEASRVLGLSAEQAGGALTAIGQSISKGAIQAEELRGQLGERLPGAFQIMARALGVTTERLSKMLEAGELKGQRMVDAWLKFAAQLRNEMSGGVADATRSAAASFQRLENTVTELAQTAGKDLLPVLGDIAGAFNALLLTQADVASGLGGALAPILREAAAGALALASGVILAGKGIAALGAFVSEGVSGLQVALADMQDFTAKMNAIIDRLLNPQAPTASTAAAETQKITLDIAKDAQTAKDRFDDWLSPLERARERLREVEKLLRDMPKTVSNAGSSISRAPTAIAALIRKHATANNVDPLLVEAIMRQESRFNPHAVSSAGAKGLMQLMPATATQYKVTNPFDPDQSIRGGVELLRDLHKTFSGNLEKVIAAYNAGAGRVMTYGGIPPSKETRAFVPAVLENLKAFQGSASGGDAAAAQEKERNDLLRERLELKRLIADIEVNTKADEIVAEVGQSRAAEFVKLAESLRDSTKALDEHEEAKIRTKIASLDASSSTRLMIEALLDEKIAAQEAAGAIEVMRERQKVLAEEAEEAAQQEMRLQEDVTRARIQGLERETAAREKQAAADKRRQEEIGGTTLGFLDGMMDALQRGGDAWEQFGQRVIDTLLRIAIEKSGFEQQLGSWIEGGLSMLANAFGGGSLTLNSSAGADAVSGGIDMSAFLSGKAEGGPVMTGKSYIVGEQGPEVITMGSPGVVTPNHQLGRAINVTFNISTPDAQSFTRSRAEVQRSMVGALQAAQRSA